MVDILNLQSFQTLNNTDRNTGDYSRIKMTPKLMVDYEDNSIVKLLDGVKFHKTLEDNTWYHAKITRIEAESRVLYSGHFLVRDCISSPGNYVLTCDWDGRPVHFMINRVRQNQETKTTNDFGYQFEEEIFDSVPSLVEAHFVSKKPITRDSMCLITFPVNRPSSGPDINNNVKTYAGQDLEDEPSEILAIDSDTIAVADNGQDVASSINSHKKLMKQDCHPSQHSSTADRPLYMPFSGMTKESRNDVRPLPPLPYAVKFRDQVAGGTEVDRDSGIGHGRGRTPENLDYDEDYHEYCDIDYEEPKSPSKVVVFRAATVPQIIGRENGTCNGGPGLPPRRPLDAFLRDSACVTDVSFYDTPKMKPMSSSFNPSRSFDHPYSECFSTLAFREKIVDEIIKIDAQSFVDVINESDHHFLGFCDNIARKGTNLCRFDLFLLPAGRQMRSDILQRSDLWTKFIIHCLIDVLSEDSTRRVNFLAKWIIIARIAATQNLYAFGYILAALESKEVHSLTGCWQELRVLHTDLALTYETQLKPKLLENQRNASSLCTQCVIPNIEPIARLLNAETRLDTWLYQWEDSDPVFGIEEFWNRLQSFRKLQDTDLYRRHESIKFCRACRKDLNNLTSLIVDSQFHLKFLAASGSSN